MTEHPPSDQLSGYALGTLSESQLEAVAKHVESCDTCDALVGQLETCPDQLGQLLRAAGSGEPLDDECRRILELVQTMTPGETAVAFTGDKEAARRAGVPPELARIGPYQLTDKLGEGGMGAVYKATHRKLKRTVAVKILPPEMVRDPRAVARFEREMEAVGKLDHPNIVRATDADEHEGIHYLVMEYVNGADLSALVHRHGPLPVADACELVRQAAVGLQHAHEHGLVHRDIKPSNLILTSDGVVKVLDLGLALLQKSAGEGELTATGQVMGTIDYMSPEQANGSHSVDIRSDIYSLGATLYKLLTGISPLSGTPHETLLSKLVRLATSPHRPLGEFRTDVPAELARFVDWLLAKEPDGRPGLPGEVAAGLEPFSEGHHVTSLLDEPGRRVVEIAAPSARSSATAKQRADAFEETFPQMESAVTRPANTAGTASAEVDELPWSSKERTQKTSIVRRPAPASSKSIGGWRRPTIVAGAILGLLLVGSGLYLGVTILIKDKDGKVVGKIELPDGHTAEVVGSRQAASQGDPTKGKTEAAGSVPAVRPNDLKPDQIVSLAERAPINDQCLVASPAKIAGVQSWTIDTVGNRGEVFAGRMSPASDQFATPAYGSSLRIWNSKNVRLERILAFPDGCGHSMAWSPDGKRVLVQSRDQSRYTLFDLVTNKTVRVISPGGAANTSILGNADWSPDGTRFAIALHGRDVGCSVWSAETGSELFRVGGDLLTVGVRWSLDGRYLATSVNSPTNPVVRVWEMPQDPAASPTLAAKLDCSDPRAQAIDVNFSWQELSWSPRGKLATATVMGRLILIWDVASGQRIHSIVCDEPERREICWSPTAELLAYGDRDKMKVFDIEKKEVVQTLPGDNMTFMQEMGWSADGQAIVSTCRTRGVDGSTVMKWKLGAAEPPQLAVGALREATMGDRNYTQFFLNADGRPVARDTQGVLCHSLTENVVLYAGDGRMVRFDQGQLKCLDARRNQTAAVTLPPPPHRRVTVSGNGKRGCCLTMDSRLFVYDIESATQIAEFACDNEVQYCEMSEDGAVILGFRPDQGRVSVYDVDRKEQRKDLISTDLHGGRAWTFSAKSDKLVMSNGGSTIVWNMSDYSVHGSVALGAGYSKAISWLGENLLAVVDERGNLHFVDTNGMRVIKQWPNIGNMARFRNGSPYLIRPLVGGATRFIDVTTGESRTFLWLRDDHWLVINQDGHIRCSDHAEAFFRYIALLDDGSQVALTPAEFAQRFGWKNDPEKVPLPE